MTRDLEDRGQLSGLREFTGKVTEQPFARGSKSEHRAVCLETPDGVFVLRRQGGNPFRDPLLDTLVGRTIRCRGELTGYLLVMVDWSVVDAA